MSSASEPVSELTTEDDMSSAQEDTSTPNDSSPPRYGMNSQYTHYLFISSVRTNGPTLCPNVWLPYAPEYVEKTS